MDIPFLLLQSFIFLALSAVIFMPLEDVFLRTEKTRICQKDFLFFFIYPIFATAIIGQALFNLARHESYIIPIEWTDAIHTLPLWIQMIIVITLAEIWIYVTHRIFHENNFLWQFHKLHHTVTKMNWSSTFRQHPVDFFVIVIGANLPAFILGIDLTPIAIFIGFQKLYTVALHSNISVHFGRFDMILASPNFHHLHHKTGRHGSNYAAIFSFLDVIGQSHKSTRLSYRHE